MKLYGTGPTRWVRCLWVLAELGVEFERVEVELSSGEHRSPEFLKLNPNGKVPVLVDGDLVLFESAAICQYLAEKYPEKQLLPQGSDDRARHHQWCYWCMTELEQPLWRMARHRFLYPEDKRLPAEIKLAREDFRQAATILDAWLADKPFVMGERFMMVDAVVGYTLVWSTWEKLLDRFPNLVAYVERLRSRASFPKEMERAPEVLVRG